MKLKAPFPYFGGKRLAAELVWSRFGAVSNYIEPFCGSAAMLVCRPDAPRIETINDLDCYVANFWRATSAEPDQMGAYADWPVNEADLHARHRWLMLSEDAIEFRQRMRTDPDYYDCRFAGWWCWGLCCWIGSGWCATTNETGSAEWEQRPDIGGWDGGGDASRGVNSKPPKRLELERKGGATPALAGSDGMGQGVVRNGKRPMLTGRSARDAAKGVQRGPNHGNGEGGCLPGVLGQPLSQKKPLLNAGGNAVGTPGAGVNGVNDNNRPQLADEFSRGRGVNGNDSAGTCEQRRAWLLDWFGALRDRLRTVRVCCGHWKRVCDSPSVTTRLGLTGVFLDPPYSTEAGRDMNLYGCDSGTVAHQAREYCLDRGSDPQMRLALCGLAGEGHEELEAHGRTVVAWKSHGGYGNRSTKGKTNSARERIWFSPHCLEVEAERFLF